MQRALLEISEIQARLASDKFVRVPAKKMVQIIAALSSTDAGTRAEGDSEDEDMDTFFAQATAQRDEEGKEVYPFKGTLCTYYAMDTWHTSAQPAFFNARRSTAMDFHGNFNNRGGHTAAIHSSGVSKGGGASASAGGGGGGGGGGGVSSATRRSAGIAAERKRRRTADTASTSAPASTATQSTQQGRGGDGSVVVGGGRIADGRPAENVVEYIDPTTNNPGVSYFRVHKAW